MAPEPLPPGSRIGILGGGQLGRMLALAAARLGMRTHVFDPAADPCAGPVVERVVCAVDCGIAVNPDNIRAQMEGGLGYGLGASLHNEITLDNGQVVQSNFHDYQLFRIQEMPRVEVHIVASTEAPTGVGEPGVPPIAPAVATAYAALTGRAIHELPIMEAIRKKRGKR